jgi:hypothetical protein
MAKYKEGEIVTMTDLYTRSGDMKKALIEMENQGLVPEPEWRICNPMRRANGSIRKGIDDTGLPAEMFAGVWILKPS